jgi:FixJ family two-component response regulator
MYQTATVFVINADERDRNEIADIVTSVGLGVEVFLNWVDFLRGGWVAQSACVVAGIGLHDRSSLELQRRLCEHDRVLPIIFVASDCDVPTTVAAMKSGAADFFIRPFRQRDLLAAIRKALARQREDEHQLSELRDLLSRFTSLTPREVNVMRLVADGRISTVIANHLHISEVVVGLDRQEVMRKMKARSLSDLIRMADKLFLSSRAQQIQEYETARLNPSPEV